MGDEETGGPARSHTSADSGLRRGGFPGLRAMAINMDTGAIVERTLAGARPIDMYVEKQNLERTVKISIAKQLDLTEFLTHFR